MDNVGIVVDDIDTAIAFFTELGMTLDGRAHVEGPWADETVGLRRIRSEIAVLQTPDGHGRLELSVYERPAPVRPDPPDAVPNTIGVHRVMFTVDDIDDTLRRLSPFGGALLGSVARYEDRYRLCYLRGPAGIIVALAEELG